MSREFHWTERCYANDFLANTETDRPVTGEPVTDAIRTMLIALAPLEYAAASYQQSDWGLADVKKEAIEQVLAIHAACATLLKAVTDYTAPEHVTSILNDMARGIGGTAAHSSHLDFSNSQLARGDLPKEVMEHAKAMRDRSMVALDLLAKSGKSTVGSFDIAAELVRRDFEAEANGMTPVTIHSSRYQVTLDVEMRVGDLNNLTRKGAA